MQDPLDFCACEEVPHRPSFSGPGVRTPEGVAAQNELADLNIFDLRILTLLPPHLPTSNVGSVLGITHSPRLQPKCFF